MRKATTALILAFGILLALANVVLGPLNQDEGVYLSAARCVAHGLTPYRDFLFLQAPAMPCVYGALHRLWDLPGTPLGPILLARLLTALLGLGAAAFAALAAARWAPAGRRRATALAVWLLTACAPAHSYFSSIPKTYALAALFLATAFLCLTAADRVRGAAFGGGVALGLAAATRHSLALAAPAVCLALWLAEPRGRRRAGFRTAFFCGLGVLFAVIPAFGLMLGTGGGRFTLAYHSARAIPGLGQWLALRAGFLSRTAQAYPLLWCLVALLFLRACRPGLRRPAQDGPRTMEPPKACAPGAEASATPVLVAAWATALAITAAHFLAPFPYDDYQTPVMPILAAAVAATLARGLPRKLSLPSLLLPGLLVSLVLAASSPLLMDWVVVRKDRLWFDQKRVPDTLALRAAGRRLRALSDAAGGNRNLLTQDAYLAVEAGLPVPRGLEMGPFSFFPHLSNEDAKRYRVHNESTLRRMMRSPYAPAVAATSGYAFAIDCPSTDRVPEETRQRLLDELSECYEPVETIPDFGQSHTALTLWRRKEAE